MRRFSLLLCLPLAVAACSDNHLSARPDVEGEGTDDDTGVDPGEGEYGSVAIQLCADGGARESLEGILVTLDHDFGQAQSRTDAEGLAVLERVPEGTWLLVAQRGGQEYRTEVDVTLGEQAFVEVDDCLDSPVIVIAHTSNELFRVDVETGDSVRLGAFNLRGQRMRDISDLAVEADSGQAYAVGMSGALYELDIGDASLTRVCDVPANANALAWSGHGRVIVGSGYDLWMVDPSTCEQKRVAKSSRQSDGDIAPAGIAQVYWAVSGGEVLRVDLLTGDSVTAYAHNLDVYGLSVVDGQLLGFTPQGGIWELSTVRGRETLKSDPVHTWWGAAAGPVAE